MLKELLQWLELRETVDQEKSEAIIKLATLLYQADGKVKMEEQELFDRLLAELPWDKSSQSKSAFHHDMIARSRDALAEHQITAYLEPIVPALKSDAHVLTMLRELAVSDGYLHQREADILKTVANLMV
ncbi:TerB family tellurite resistance protein [Reinekea blandensis]|uniref:Co-chaperone DjlA N-terminal domain-containing protein n=1 Tax=Reinekea blandensis MED297 TaxID=314283 RepID=A4BJ58_9GAMM|nr:TerB family tellurite resistance protein [Reinekea blandensis]EAR07811.1 hypothetical protein MED297_05184 [Reinekea sp. MED297] [Reinekea blandensis MED297]